MATYQYTARSRDGRSESGSIEADSRQAVLQKIRGMGLVPVSINEERAARGSTADRGRATPRRRGGRRIRSDDMILFTRSLSTMVNAGLPLIQGIDILIEQTENANFKSTLTTVGLDVEGGLTFSEALAKHPRAFSDLYCSMVRAGEASGSLDIILVRLAEYLESTEQLKREIRSAMTYPVVAFAIVILIASGLLIFIVPAFEDIFSGLGGTLPAPTRALIAVSDLLRRFFLLVLLVMVAAFFGLRWYISRPFGRYQWDSMLLRLPVFGPLFRKVAISRFARTLSTLTRSGVPVLAALEIVERTTGNEVVGKVVHASQESIKAGATIAEPMAQGGIFPPMVIRMIEVGERTGALDTLLSKVADFYDQQVESTVKQLTSLIEPLLILLLGIIVGGMVIALFMPIFELSTLLA